MKTTFLNYIFPNAITDITLALSLQQTAWEKGHFTC